MKRILSREIQHQVNRRAHELAKAAYEDFRMRMAEDADIRMGRVKPVDWQPSEWIAKK